MKHPELLTLLLNTLSDDYKLLHKEKLEIMGLSHIQECVRQELHDPWRRSAMAGRDKLTSPDFYCF